MSLLVAELPLGVQVWRNGGELLPWTVTHTPAGLKQRQLNRSPGVVSFERTEAGAMAEAIGLVGWLKRFKKFPMLKNNDRWPWSTRETVG